MGIFSRINDIVSSNIVHMLDKAEDPEKMVRLMIGEMEDTLIEVKSGAAKLIAEQKSYQRQKDVLLDEKESWQQRASLAIEKGREDLARGAIKEKLRLQDQLDAIEKRAAETTAVLEQTRIDIRSLSDKLEDARERQKSLVNRRRSLESQKKVQNTLSTHGSAKAFEKFESYADSIDQLEGEVVISRTKGEGQALGEAFENLEKEDLIEKELQNLRSAKTSEVKKSQQDSKSNKSEKQ